LLDNKDTRSFAIFLLCYFDIIIVNSFYNGDYDKSNKKNRY